MEAHILNRSSYGVEDAEYAISQLAQTTMRSEIGQLSLDHVLKERANLNANITAAINEAAQDWGVTCLRYEIRDIHAPRARRRSHAPPGHRRTIQACRNPGI